MAYNNREREFGTSGTVDQEFTIDYGTVNWSVHFRGLGFIFLQALFLDGAIFSSTGGVAVGRKQGKPDC